MSPSSVPQFPQAKDTGPAGALAWPGRAAVFHAAAQLLSPEQRWMFRGGGGGGGVFPGGSARFWDEAEETLVRGEARQVPGCWGRSDASFNASRRFEFSLDKANCVLPGVRPAEPGELLIHGWVGSCQQGPACSWPGPAGQRLPALGSLPPDVLAPGPGGRCGTTCPKHFLRDGTILGQLGGATEEIRRGWGCWQKTQFVAASFPPCQGALSQRVLTRRCRDGATLW